MRGLSRQDVSPAGPFPAKEGGEVAARQVSSIWLELKRSELRCPLQGGVMALTVNHQAQGYRLLRFNAGEKGDSFDGRIEEMEILTALDLMDSTPTPDSSPQGGGES